MSEPLDGKTTDDLIAEAGEDELLPAADDPEEIEPYEDATPVPVEDE